MKTIASRQAIDLVAGLALICLAQAASASAPDPNAVYLLSNMFLKEQTVLTVGPNNQLKMTARAGSPNQLWRFSPLGNGYYRITNKSLGESHAIDSDTQAPNLRPTGNFSGQFWKVIPTGNGFYRLSNMFQTDAKSFDTYGNAPHDPFLGNTGNYSGQFWRLTPHVETAVNPSQNLQLSVSPLQVSPITLDRPLAPAPVTNTLTIQGPVLSNQPSISADGGQLVVGPGPTLPNQPAIQVQGCIANPAQCAGVAVDPAPQVQGKRNCPTVATTTVLGAPRPYLVPCRPEKSPFDWQQAQYPEPGVYQLLGFNSLNSTMPLVEKAFADPAAVKRFIASRAEGDPAAERALWLKLVNSPEQSPEFKALLFAALLRAIETGDAQASANFQRYVDERKAHMSYELDRIYASWLEVDAVTRGESTRRMAGGVGMPIPIPLNNSGGAMNPDMLGAEPIDAVGIAWLAIVPDADGNATLATIKDLVDLQRNSQAGAAAGSFNPAYLLPLYNVLSIPDAANRLANSKALAKFLDSPGALGAQMVLSIVSAAVDLGVGIDRLVRIEKMKGAIDKNRTAWRAAPDLRSMLGSDDGKQELLAFWALGTAEYRAGPEKGKGKVTGCGQQPVICQKTRERMKRVATQAGVRL